MHSSTHWGGKVPSGCRIQVYYSMLAMLTCVSPSVRYSRRRGQPWGPLHKEQSRLCWRSHQEAQRPWAAPALLRTHEQMYREVYETFWDSNVIFLNHTTTEICLFTQGRVQEQVIYTGNRLIPVTLEPAKTDVRVSASTSQDGCRVVKDTRVRRAGQAPLAHGCSV